MVMEKLKRFIDLKVDTETCNLRCEYCYVAQNRKFNSNLFKLNFGEDDLRMAFSKKRLGGTCLINFCAGGETLLSDDIMKVIKILLECGHYLMIVTNGTIYKRFLEFSNYDIEYRNRLFIKFSFHYLELKKLNMLDAFFKNVRLMKESQISYTIELGAFDKYVDYINEINDICIKNVGAKPHITPLRDERKDDFSLLTDYNRKTI